MKIQIRFAEILGVGDIEVVIDNSVLQDIPAICKIKTIDSHAIAVGPRGGVYIYPSPWDAIMYLDRKDNP